MAKHDKRRLTERLFRRVYYKYFARNLLYELQIRARASSADYVEAHMSEAIIFERHPNILQYGIEEGVGKRRSRSGFYRYLGPVAAPQ